MDDTLLFIPPCCVDKKLPRAVMEAPHRALTFYTHSDVPMEKFYRAISYLIADAHIMVLTMPHISHQVAAFLRQCFERGWITDLILSTNRDTSAVIKSYLPEYSEHILYTYGKDVLDITSHLVLYTDTQALSISGPMWEIGGNAPLACYTLLYYSRFNTMVNGDFSNSLQNILLPDVLRHRKARHKETQLPSSKALSHFLNHNFPPYKE